MSSFAVNVRWLEYTCKVCIKLVTGTNVTSICGRVSLVSSGSSSTLSTLGAVAKACVLSCEMLSAVANTGATSAGCLTFVFKESLRRLSANKRAASALPLMSLSLTLSSKVTCCPSFTRWNPRL